MSFITDSEGVSANGTRVDDEGFDLAVVGILCEEHIIRR